MNKVGVEFFEVQCKAELLVKRVVFEGDSANGKVLILWRPIVSVFLWNKD
jgi:hypothetical protein